MRNHWTSYLPEFGRHLRVSTSVSNTEQIAYLKKEIERLEFETAQNEALLLIDIKENWSQDEISEAKIQFDQAKYLKP